MSKLSRFTLVSLFALAFASYGVAYAQEEGGEEGGEGGGEEGGGEAGGGEAGGGEAGGGEAAAAAEEGGGAAHGLNLAKGKIAIQAAVGVNLSKDAVAKPFAIAPTIWYGVSDKLTVALHHDNGRTPYTPGPGFGGLCLAGESKGCAKVYNNIGLDAIFGLSQGNMTLAAHGGLDFHAIDPMHMVLRAGVLGRYTAGKIHVDFDPYVYLGLTKRDEGNFKQWIFVPVYLWYMANDKMGIYLHTGLNASLSDPGLGDSWSVPLGLGMNYMLSDKMGVGLDVLFPAPVGADLVKTKFDGRVLGLRFMMMM